jgi:hypothetical protein
MKFKVAISAALFVAAAASFSAAVQAGTCQSVRAKGVAKTLALATLYAQADLAQTAKHMKGKVTQTSTNCVPGPSNYKCKIDAVVCPK